LLHSAPPTKENYMFERFHSKTMTATAAALLSALGVGGIAVAQSGKSASKAPANAAQTAEAPENTTGPDTDNIESGDQTTPDAPATASVSSKKLTKVSSKAKASQAAEAPGTETPDSGTEAPEAPGSETPGNDGPGGHADEPGNPNAQHEATGTE
jgi:hypothetical protein